MAESVTKLHQKDFANAKLYADRFTFPSFDRRKIEANFDGGDVSGDGGIMLLREADRRLRVLEKRANRRAALSFHRVIVDNFIASFAEAPELVLDFDSTDDRVHGNQEKRASHGY